MYTCVQWCVVKLKLKEKKAIAKAIAKKESENVPPSPAAVSQLLADSVSVSLSRLPPLSPTPSPRVSASVSSLQHHRSPAPRRLSSPPPLVPGDAVSTVVPLGLQPWLTEGATASAGRLTTANDNVPRSHTISSLEKAHVKAVSSLTSYAAADSVTSSKPACGQMLNLPANVLRVLDLRKKIALVVDETTVIVGPENLKCAGGGVRILLPAGTLPQSLISPGTGKSLNIHIDKTNPDCQLLCVRQANTTANAVHAAHATITSAANAKSSACHFLKLQLGFDSMLEIFQYLSLGDLFR